LRVTFRDETSANAPSGDATAPIGRMPLPRSIVRATSGRRNGIERGRGRNLYLLRSSLTRFPRDRYSFFAAPPISLAARK
jgi:hypothetical protein